MEKLFTSVLCILKKKREVIDMIKELDLYTVLKMVKELKDNHCWYKDSILIAGSRSANFHGEDLKYFLRDYTLLERCKSDYIYDKKLDKNYTEEYTMLKDFIDGKNSFKLREAYYQNCPILIIGVAECYRIFKAALADFKYIKSFTLENSDYPKTLQKTFKRAVYDKKFRNDLDNKLSIFESNNYFSFMPNAKRYVNCIDSWGYTYGWDKAYYVIIKYLQNYESEYYLYHIESDDT